MRLIIGSFRKVLAYSPAPSAPWASPFRSPSRCRSWTRISQRDALAEALRATDADAAAVFAEFTEAGLGATPARELWRNLMGTGLSHFRGFVAESFRDEGRLEGRVENRGEDILRILAVRGVAVPDEARQRITDCKDLAVLDVWFERAVTAPTADAVFDES